jgi:hypothetical protein
MKVKKIVAKMYQAIIDKDTKLEKKLWMKALKKSLKHKKHTQ